MDTAVVGLMSVSTHWQQQKVNLSASTHWQEQKVKLERIDTLARTESELVHCIKSDKLRYFVHMMMREPFDTSESSVMTGFVKHGQPKTIS